VTKKIENLDGQRLSDNLEALFNYVQRVRTEIASLNQSGDGEDKFATMGEQLDGVVEATKEASDSIMEAIEHNNEALTKLKDSIEDAELIDLLDTIENGNNAVFEACAFQDITGQRVSKIVKSVTYVEERVSALREIWGDKELDNVELAVEELTEDEKLLNGPQSKEKAISQDEIDALFEGVQNSVSLA
jgi:chemotaxis protein CheZ